MPFTFAHPAAILPLRRSRFLQTVPLIIGSIVPDAPYFFPPWLGPAAIETHTVYASFTVDVPLGMALLMLTLLLREPLTILLGARARWICLRSIERFYERPLHWLIGAFSILIGSWTHIAWDSFTHDTGWTTEHVAALSAPVSIWGWNTETAHFLQYLSSVFGLVLLAIWFRGLLARVPASVSRDQSRPGARWLLLAMIAVASLMIGISRAFLAWRPAVEGIYHLVYLLLTRTIGWFIALYLAAGILVLLSRRRRLEPEPAS